ncbi:OmpP1/FadL family transporter [Hymenobacter psychrophilus]|uniref:Long-chain fatty acid transport protein n=1 Tax=Hymenobacter psychrophilus TaxID=651662 RepID=A0A1H3HHQ0_9BACT|nr:hypothetical protein [Hymenobacter psychrophilus]SDY14992.1 hypothetical protein SAMN04488069_1062 [Hymenobacter psychrophilus]
MLDSDAKAFGNTATDSRSNLNIASAGLVLTRRRPDGDGSAWRAGSFGLGITRTANYNQNLRYSGRPARNQNIFQRLGQDQNTTLDDLAYDTYLTERDDEGTYVPADFFDTGALDQGESIRTSGSTTQFDLAYGASYLDKLYIGAGVGITSVRYNSENILTASAVNPNDPASAFESLTLRDDIRTTGGGVNLRLGLIYRPIDAVRIGASIQTPTYIQFNETYNSSLQAQFNRPVVVEGQSYRSPRSAADPNLVQYALTTPFKATGGVAVVIGKYGFLSGDVEYLDYSSSRISNYNNNRYDFSFDNDDIKALQQSAVNLRVGGEARFDVFRARLGFAYYGDPYQNSNYDQSRKYLTGGVGVRQNNFFVDVAGVYGKGNTLYTPYTIYGTDGRPSAVDTPVVEVADKQFNFTATAGFLF